MIEIVNEYIGESLRHGLSTVLGNQEVQYRMSWTSMECTGPLPYRILKWFNVQSLYCILIYENHLDFGDITEEHPRGCI